LKLRSCGTIYITPPAAQSGNLTMSSQSVTTSTSSPVAVRWVCATSIATALLLASAGYAQGGQPAASESDPANGQVNASVDPKSESCTALKARLNAAGEMSIVSGPRGAWGDTFYGPAVPRCQFWQMPVFTYVKARDGLCGVGYICVEKLTFD
jgi:hypothetical protein